MKRFAIAVCLISILLMRPITGIGQQLLQNVGFENWTAGIPDNWTLEPNCTINQESPSYSGTYCVRLGGDRSIFQPGYNQISQIYQIITAEPGTSYDFHFWAKGKNAWDPWYAYSYVIWLDAGQNQISVDGFNIHSGSGGALLNWTVCGPFTVQAPAGAAYAKIRFKRSSWGYLDIDEVTFSVAQPPRDSAVHGYWRFDEGSGSIAYDSSAYGNNGTLQNMDTTTCWVDGKIGKALEFDGIDDYLDCGNDTSLHIMNELTIETLVRFNELTSGEYILSNNLYSIYHRGEWAGDRIYFLFRIVEEEHPGHSSWDYRGGVKTGIELQIHRWYHIAAVMSGDTMRIYVDGEKQGENTCLSNYTKDASQRNNLFLGKYPFHGILDEVIIHNRALSGYEILQRAVHGCWRFDEGSGSIAYDSSAYGNDGTLQNMDTTTCWVDGKEGKALRFDGVDDYVECEDNEGIKYILSDHELTYMAWIFPQNINGDIMGFSSGGYSLGLVNQKLQLKFQDHGGTWHEVISTLTVPQNQWTNIAVTFSASAGKAVFYVNGEPETISETGICGTTVAEFRMGWNNCVHFNGIMDEVLVYNIALDNIESHYIPPDCGAESNPTGNPIGGSTGYTNIISTYDYFVTNKSELLSALASATSGQIVYVADSAQIDLTGEKNIVIQPGVTLASGRGYNGSQGGMVYTTQHDGHILPLFNVNGGGVRITGIRLQGPDPEIGDHENYYDEYCHQYCLSRGIQTEHSLEVDNCELWGWSHAGIFLDKGATNCYIHHNYIHHNRRAGLGYGVCLGYSDEDNSIDAVIEANIFDYCRHGIASTGNPYSSYEAKYNIALEHANGHNFDRHGTETPHVWWGGDAGDWTIIHHNTDRTNIRAVSIRGKPVKGAEIFQNWFYSPNRASAIKLYTDENVSIYNNYYSLTPPPGAEGKLPSAVARADCNEGVVPLHITFDGSGSYDPDGMIVFYHWDFGDGNTARGQIVSYTFNSVGRYNVTLTVNDNDGIPIKDMIPITVSPISENCVLSFWVKDSYRDHLTNRYFIQALIDGEIVWEEDAAGDEGWIHVVENVTSLVENKNEVTLSFRVFTPEGVPLSEIIDFYTYWDDVILFGYDVSNGDFESLDSWKYTENEEKWGGDYQIGDVRSGKWAYGISHEYNHDAIAGSWAQIEQSTYRSGYVPTKGDVNLDDTVNILDVLMTVNFILGIIELTPSQEGVADCNGDSIVNILDVIGIVNKILGIGDCPPISCKPEVTPETMEFLKALESHFTPEDFARFMALVEEAQVPEEYFLGQNYPNPFNPNTDIRYQITAPSRDRDGIGNSRYPIHTTLKIYNILGQEIRTLVDELQEPGYYTITWDGRDSSGPEVASGIYFYRLQAGDFVQTKRMLLLK